MEARGFVERHGGHGQDMFGLAFERLLLDMLAVACTVVENDRKSGSLQNSRNNLSLVFGPIDTETGAIQKFGPGWKQTERAKVTSMFKALALRGTSGCNGGQPSITISLKAGSDSTPIKPPDVKKPKKDGTPPEKKVPKRDKPADETEGTKGAKKPRVAAAMQPELRQPLDLERLYSRLIKETVRHLNTDKFAQKCKARDQAGKAYGNLVGLDFLGQKPFVDEAWARHELEGKGSGAFVKYSGDHEEEMDRNCPAGRIFPGKCTHKKCIRKSTHAGTKLLPLTTRIDIQKLADKLAKDAGVESVNTNLPDATADPVSATSSD